MTLYRIAKWQEVFERAESRKLKQLSWIAMPIGFTSTGFQAMLDEFEEDAASIYGAWCALTAVAASCPCRGVLGNSRGIPLKISHIARMTGFNSAVFERLYSWAASDSVRWLEEVSAGELATMYEENAVFPQEYSSSGKSPDDPPTRQGNPPCTRHNRTVHNRTEQDNAAAAWAADAFKDLDFEEVKRLAEKLYRCKQSLSKDFVWQVCVVGQALQPGLVGEWIQSLAEPGKVSRPRRYLEVAIGRECESRGFTWSDACVLVKKGKGNEC